MKKKLKKIILNVLKSNKAVLEFIKKTIKNYNSMKEELKKIWLMAMICAFASCGTTQVSVQKPAEGTQTTITVTTNNPIKTDINPTINKKEYQK